MQHPLKIPPTSQNDVLFKSPLFDMIRSLVSMKPLISLMRITKRNPFFIPSHISAPKMGILIFWQQLFSNVHTSLGLAILSVREKLLEGRLFARSRSWGCRWIVLYRGPNSTVSLQQFGCGWTTSSKASSSTSEDILECLFFACSCYQITWNVRTRFVPHVRWQLISFPHH